MNTKTFLTVQAILSFLFAISMIFMSAQMTERYMADPSWENPATKLIRQGMGAFLLGIAVGSWQARNAEQSRGLNAFLLSSLIGNLLLVVFHINAIVQKVEKDFAWVSAIICLSLAVWVFFILRSQKK
jgi:peptidoglycan/LPS O-acetylase OafA/YrhL